MSTIQDLFEQAQLAEAAYADFSSPDVTFKLALISKGMSEAQADAFTNEWSVVDQYTASGGLLGQGTGFSATVFKNKAGEYSFAIRGSTDANDFLADAKLITTDGIAVSQLVDMYNYWQSLTHLGVYQVRSMGSEINGVRLH